MPVPQSTKRRLAQVGIGIFAIVMIVFWTWALFIADPEPVNRIGDRAWAERAEARCAAADAQLDELANFTVLEEGNSTQIQQRADIIEQANQIIADMLADLSATTPTDAKGQAVIPAWLDDYQTYLADRSDYVALLRSTGDNRPFSETITDQGIPISELLETFAGDNRMPSCAPKKDLT